jgi:hypothetical protein
MRRLNARSKDRYENQSCEMSHIDSPFSTDTGHVTNMRKHRSEVQVRQIAMRHNTP